MSDRFSLLILPGDGIGPEVMAEVRKVIAWFGKRRGLVFDVDEDLVGGAAYDAHGTPLSDATMARPQAIDSSSTLAQPSRLDASTMASAAL